MRTLFKQRAFLVVAVLALYFALASILPLAAHQGLYTVSLLIKDLLVWILPPAVGFFIAGAIASFRSRAPLFILTLVLFEAVSNLSSVWYAYVGGHMAVDFLPAMASPVQASDFQALWRLPLERPAWWSADKGSLFGLALGLAAAFGRNALLRTAIDRGKETAQWILTRVFSRLIPLFVLGFVARMHKGRLLDHMAGTSAALVAWLVILLALYIGVLFAVGSGWSVKGTAAAVKNLLPAGGIAFTSGCSLSTMPWTIAGTAKNLQKPWLAKAVIPATTNIQQIGDCIANTFICFLLYRHFHGQVPDLSTWMSFSAIFVLARFATTAMLGGAIFVMLPIYEKYLHFNAEMTAIILAFNVILDPLITSCNVVANGALCRVFERMWLALPVRARGGVESEAEKKGSD